VYDLLQLDTSTLSRNVQRMRAHLRRGNLPGPGAVSFTGPKDDVIDAPTVTQRCGTTAQRSGRSGLQGRAPWPSRQGGRGRLQRPDAGPGGTSLPPAVKKSSRAPSGWSSANQRALQALGDSHDSVR